MEHLGSQRLIDGVCTARRALAQGALEHPQQYVGVGNDAGHTRVYSALPNSASCLAALMSAISIGGSLSASAPTGQGRS